MSVRRRTAAAFEERVGGGAKDPQSITALSRGVAVLRAFGEAGGPLTNQDLVAATGLPKSTVSRITRTLTIDGFLSYLRGSGMYQLAPAVLRLARAHHNSTGLADIAGPHMQELATEIRATVAVAARDRLDMVYVAIARGVTRIHVPQEPGYRVPIGRTATGLAYFHAIPPALRHTLADALRRHRPAEWSSIRRDIERTGQEIARHGFCVCAGTWRSDVNGVGVPLVLPDGSVVAFNVGGPPFWLKIEKIHREIGPRLVDMARNVGAEFARRGRAVR